MKRILPILVLVAILNTSCLNDNSCKNCISSPLAFAFTLLPSEDGMSMINDTTFVPDSIKLYYLKNNVKEPVTFVFGGSSYFGNYIYTVDISKVSAGDSIKVFYLYLSHTDTDTIYFDCNIVNDGCCSYYSYDSLSYNGKSMPYSSTYGINYAIKARP